MLKLQADLTVEAKGEFNNFLLQDVKTEHWKNNDILLEQLRIESTNVQMLLNLRGK